MNQNAAQETKTEIFFILPLLPGQAEAWRRFVQELREPQRQAWAAWRQRVGLRWLRVWLQTSRQATAVFVQARFPHSAGFPQPLVDENEAFDRWLREQLFTLHGLDIAQFDAGVKRELVLEVDV